jgi:hypothetical protein
MMSMGMGEGKAYKLDPKQFPRRIELELSEETFEAMQKLADATGRSISEIATDTLPRTGVWRGKLACPSPEAMKALIFMPPAIQ